MSPDGVILVSAGEGGHRKLSKIAGPRNSEAKEVRDISAVDSASADSAIRKTRATCRGEQVARRKCRGDGGSTGLGTGAGRARDWGNPGGSPSGTGGNGEVESKDRAVRGFGLPICVVNYCNGKTNEKIPEHPSDR